MRRPHVVNRRVLGGVVLRENDVERGKVGGWFEKWWRRGGGCRDLERGRSDGARMDDTPAKLNLGPDGVSHDGHVTCLVRELLPRMRSMPPSNEAIITGEVIVRV